MEHLNCPTPVNTGPETLHTSVAMLPEEISGYALQSPATIIKKLVSFDFFSEQEIIDLTTASLRSDDIKEALQAALQITENAIKEKTALLSAPLTEDMRAGLQADIAQRQFYAAHLQAIMERIELNKTDFFDKRGADAGNPVSEVILTELPQITDKRFAAGITNALKPFLKTTEADLKDPIRLIHKEEDFLRNFLYTRNLRNADRPLFDKIQFLLTQLKKDFPLADANHSQASIDTYINRLTVGLIFIYGEKINELEVKLEALAGDKTALDLFRKRKKAFLQFLVTVTAYEYTLNNVYHYAVDRKKVAEILEKEQKQNASLLERERVVYDYFVQNIFPTLAENKKKDTSKDGAFQGSTYYYLGKYIDQSNPGSVDLSEYIAKMTDDFFNEDQLLSESLLHDYIKDRVRYDLPGPKTAAHLIKTGTLLNQQTNRVEKSVFFNFNYIDPLEIVSQVADADNVALFEQLTADLFSLYMQQADYKRSEKAVDIRQALLQLLNKEFSAHANWFVTVTDTLKTEYVQLFLSLFDYQIKSATTYTAVYDSLFIEKLKQLILFFRAYGLSIEESIQLNHRIATSITNYFRLLHKDSDPLPGKMNPQALRSLVLPHYMALQLTARSGLFTEMVRYLVEYMHILNSSDRLYDFSEEKRRAIMNKQLAYVLEQLKQTYPELSERDWFRLKTNDFALIKNAYSKFRDRLHYQYIADADNDTFITFQLFSEQAAALRYGETVDKVTRHITDFVDGILPFDKRTLYNYFYHYFRSQLRPLFRQAKQAKRDIKQVLKNADYKLTLFYIQDDRIDTGSVAVTDADFDYDLLSEIYQTVENEVVFGKALWEFELLQESDDVLWKRKRENLFLEENELVFMTYIYDRDKGYANMSDLNAFLNNLLSLDYNAQSSALHRTSFNDWFKSSRNTPQARNNNDITDKVYIVNIRPDDVSPEIIRKLQTDFYITVPKTGINFLFYVPPSARIRQDFTLMGILPNTDFIEKDPPQTGFYLVNKAYYDFYKTKVLDVMEKLRQQRSEKAPLVLRYDVNDIFYRSGSYVQLSDTHKNTVTLAAFKRNTDQFAEIRGYLQTGKPRQIVLSVNEKHDFPIRYQKLQVIDFWNKIKNILKAPRSQKEQELLLAYWDLLDALSDDNGEFKDYNIGIKKDLLKQRLDEYKNTALTLQQKMQALDEKETALLRKMPPSEAQKLLDPEKQALKRDTDRFKYGLSKLTHSVLRQLTKSLLNKIEKTADGFTDVPDFIDKYDQVKHYFLNISSTEKALNRDKYIKALETFSDFMDLLVDNNKDISFNGPILLESKSQGNFEPLANVDDNTLLSDFGISYIQGSSGTIALHHPKVHRLEISATDITLHPVDFGQPGSENKSDQADQAPVTEDQTGYERAQTAGDQPTVDQSQAPALASEAAFFTEETAFEATTEVTGAATDATADAAEPFFYDDFSTTGDDDFSFSLQSSGMKDVTDIKAAYAEIRRVMGDLPVKVSVAPEFFISGRKVAGYARILQDVLYLGITGKDGQLDRFVLNHEIFHGVFRMLLSRHERQMYKQYVRDTFSEREILSQAYPFGDNTFRVVDDTALEEFLANGYALYRKRANTFLERLYRFIDYIKSLLGLRYDKLAIFFDRIARGYYKGKSGDADIAPGLLYMQSKGKKTFYDLFDDSCITEKGIHMLTGKFRSLVTNTLYTGKGVFDLVHAIKASLLQITKKKQLIDNYITFLQNVTEESNKDSRILFIPEGLSFDDARKKALDRITALFDEKRRAGTFKKLIHLLYPALYDKIGNDIYEELEESEAAMHAGGEVFFPVEKDVEASIKKEVGAFLSNIPRLPDTTAYAFSFDENGQKHNGMRKVTLTPDVFKNTEFYTKKEVTTALFTLFHALGNKNYDSAEDFIKDLQRHLLSDSLSGLDIALFLFLFKPKASVSIDKDKNNNPIVTETIDLIQDKNKKTLCRLIITYEQPAGMNQSGDDKIERKVFFVRSLAQAVNIVNPLQAQTYSRAFFDTRYFTDEDRPAKDTLTNLLSVFISSVKLNLSIIEGYRLESDKYLLRSDFGQNKDLNKITNDFITMFSSVYISDPKLYAEAENKYNALSDPDSYVNFLKQVLENMGMQHLLSPKFLAKEGPEKVKLIQQLMSKAFLLKAGGINPQELFKSGSIRSTFFDIFTIERQVQNDSIKVSQEKRVRRIKLFTAISDNSLTAKADSESLASFPYFIKRDSLPDMIQHQSIHKQELNNLFDTSLNDLYYLLFNVYSLENPFYKDALEGVNQFYFPTNATQRPYFTLLRGLFFGTRHSNNGIHVIENTFWQLLGYQALEGLYIMAYFSEIRRMQFFFLHIQNIIASLQNEDLKQALTEYLQSIYDQRETLSFRNAKSIESKKFSKAVISELFTHPDVVNGVHFIVKQKGEDTFSLRIGNGIFSQFDPDLTLRALDFEFNNDLGPARYLIEAYSGALKNVREITNVLPADIRDMLVLTPADAEKINAHIAQVANQLQDGSKYPQYAAFSKMLNDILEKGAFLFGELIPDGNIFSRHVKQDNPLVFYNRTAYINEKIGIQQPSGYTPFVTRRLYFNSPGLQFKEDLFFLQRYAKEKKAAEERSEERSRALAALDQADELEVYDVEYLKLLDEKKKVDAYYNILDFNDYFKIMAAQTVDELKALFYEYTGLSFDAVSQTQAQTQPTDEAVSDAQAFFASETNASAQAQPVDLAAEIDPQADTLYEAEYFPPTQEELEAAAATDLSQLNLPEHILAEIQAKKKASDSNVAADKETSDSVNETSASGQAGEPLRLYRDKETLIKDAFRGNDDETGLSYETAKFILFRHDVYANLPIEKAINLLTVSYNNYLAGQAILKTLPQRQLSGFSRFTFLSDISDGMRAFVMYSLTQLSSRINDYVINRYFLVDSFQFEDVSDNVKRNALLTTPGMRSILIEGSVNSEKQQRVDEVIQAYIQGKTPENENAVAFPVAPKVKEEYYTVAVFDLNTRSALLDASLKTTDGAHFMSPLFAYTHHLGLGGIHALDSYNHTTKNIHSGIRYQNAVFMRKIQGEDVRYLYQGRYAEYVKCASHTLNICLRSINPAWQAMLDKMYANDPVLLTLQAATDFFEVHAHLNTAAKIGLKEALRLLATVTLQQYLAPEKRHPFFANRPFFPVLALHKNVLKSLFGLNNIQDAFFNVTVNNKTVNILEIDAVLKALNISEVSKTFTSEKLLTLTVEQSINHLWKQLTEKAKTINLALDPVVDMYALAGGIYAKMDAYIQEKSRQDKDFRIIDAVNPTSTIKASQRLMFADLSDFLTASVDKIKAHVYESKTKQLLFVSKSQHETEDHDAAVSSQLMAFTMTKSADDAQANENAMGLRNLFYLTSELRKLQLEDELGFTLPDKKAGRKRMIRFLRQHATGFNNNEDTIALAQAAEQTDMNTLRVSPSQGYAALSIVKDEVNKTVRANRLYGAPLILVPDYSGVTAKGTLQDKKDDPYALHWVMPEVDLTYFESVLQTKGLDTGLLQAFKAIDSKEAQFQFLVRLKNTLIDKQTNTQRSLTKDEIKLVKFISRFYYSYAGDTRQLSTEQAEVLKDKITAAINEAGLFPDPVAKEQVDFFYQALYKESDAVIVFDYESFHQLFLNIEPAEAVTSTFDLSLIPESLLKEKRAAYTADEILRYEASELLKRKYESGKRVFAKDKEAILAFLPKLLQFSDKTNAGKKARLLLHPGELESADDITFIKRYVTALSDIYFLLKSTTAENTEALKSDFIAFLHQSDEIADVHVSLLQISKKENIVKGSLFNKNLSLYMYGVRIPCSGINSSLPIKAKVLLNTNSNYLIIPREVLEIHGSDYDIDKLFTYLLRSEVIDNNKVFLLHAKTSDAISKSLLKNRGVYSVTAEEIRKTIKNTFERKKDLIGFLLQFQDKLHADNLLPEQKVVLTQAVSTLLPNKDAVADLRNRLYDLLLQLHIETRPDETLLALLNTAKKTADRIGKTVVGAVEGFVDLMAFYKEAAGKPDFNLQSALQINNALLRAEEKIQRFINLLSQPLHKLSLKRHKNKVSVESIFTDLLAVMTYGNSKADIAQALEKPPAQASKKSGKKKQRRHNLTYLLQLHPGSHISKRVKTAYDTLFDNLIVNYLYFQGTNPVLYENTIAPVSIEVFKDVKSNQFESPFGILDFAGQTFANRDGLASVAIFARGNDNIMHAYNAGMKPFNDFYTGDLQTYRWLYLSGLINLSLEQLKVLKIEPVKVNALTASIIQVLLASGKSIDAFIQDHFINRRHITADPLSLLGFFNEHVQALLSEKEALDSGVSSVLKTYTQLMELNKTFTEKISKFLAKEYALIQDMEAEFTELLSAALNGVTSSGNVMKITLDNKKYSFNKEFSAVNKALSRLHLLKQQSVVVNGIHFGSGLHLLTALLFSSNKALQEKLITSPFSNKQLIDFLRTHYADSLLSQVDDVTAKVLYGKALLYVYRVLLAYNYGGLIGLLNEKKTKPLFTGGLKFVFAAEETASLPYPDLISNVFSNIIPFFISKETDKDTVIRLEYNSDEVKQKGYFPYYGASPFLLVSSGMESVFPVNEQFPFTLSEKPLVAFSKQNQDPLRDLVVYHALLKTAALTENQDVSDITPETFHAFKKQIKQLLCTPLFFQAFPDKKDAFIAERVLPEIMLLAGIRAQKAEELQNLSFFEKLAAAFEAESHHMDDLAAEVKGAHDTSKQVMTQINPLTLANKRISHPLLSLSEAEDVYQVVYTAAADICNIIENRVMQSQSDARLLFLPDKVTITDLRLAFNNAPFDTDAVNTADMLYTLLSFFKDNFILFYAAPSKAVLNDEAALFSLLRQAFLVYETNITEQEADAKARNFIFDFPFKRSELLYVINTKLKTGLFLNEKNALFASVNKHLMALLFSENVIAEVMTSGRDLTADDFLTGALADVADFPAPERDRLLAFFEGKADDNGYPYFKVNMNKLSQAAVSLRVAANSPHLLAKIASVLHIMYQTKLQTIYADPRMEQLIEEIKFTYLQLFNTAYFSKSNTETLIAGTLFRDIIKDIPLSDQYTLHKVPVADIFHNVGFIPSSIELYSTVIFKDYISGLKTLYPKNYFLDKFTWDPTRQLFTFDLNIYQDEDEKSRVKVSFADLEKQLYKDRGEKESLSYLLGLYLISMYHIDYRSKGPGFLISEDIGFLLDKALPEAAERKLDTLADNRSDVITKVLMQLNLDLFKETPLAGFRNTEITQEKLNQDINSRYLFTGSSSGKYVNAAGLTYELLTDKSGNQAVVAAGLVAPYFDLKLTESEDKTQVKPIGNYMLFFSSEYQTYLLNVFYRLTDALLHPDKTIYTSEENLFHQAAEFLRSGKPIEKETPGALPPPLPNLMPLLLHKIQEMQLSSEAQATLSAYIQEFFAESDFFHLILLKNHFNFYGLLSELTRFFNQAEDERTHTLRQYWKALFIQQMYLQEMRMQDKDNNLMSFILLGQNHDAFLKINETASKTENRFHIKPVIKTTIKGKSVVFVLSELHITSMVYDDFLTGKETLFAPAASASEKKSGLDLIKNSIKRYVRYLLQMQNKSDKADPLVDELLSFFFPSKKGVFNAAEVHHDKVVAIYRRLGKEGDRFSGLEDAPVIRLYHNQTNENTLLEKEKKITWSNRQTGFEQRIKIEPDAVTALASDLKITNRIRNLYIDPSILKLAFQNSQVAFKTKLPHNTVVNISGLYGIYGIVKKDEHNPDYSVLQLMTPAGAFRLHQAAISGQSLTDIIFDPELYFSPAQLEEWRTFITSGELKPESSNPEVPPTAVQSKLLREASVLNTKVKNPDTAKLDRFFRLFNVPYRLIDSAEMQLLGLQPDTKGVILNGKVYLNKDTFTAGTAFHEIAHLLLLFLKKENNALYHQLLKEAEKHVWFSVLARYYPHLDPEQLAVETAVTILEEHMVKKETFISENTSVIVRIWQQILDFIRRFLAPLLEPMLGDVWRHLSYTTSLSELADIFHRQFFVLSRRLDLSEFLEETRASSLIIDADAVPQSEYAFALHFLDPAADLMRINTVKTKEDYYKYIAEQALQRLDTEVLNGTVYYREDNLFNEKQLYTKEEYIDLFVKKRLFFDKVNDQTQQLLFAILDKIKKLQLANATVSLPDNTMSLLHTIYEALTQAELQEQAHNLRMLGLDESQIRSVLPFAIENLTREELDLLQFQDLFRITGDNQLSLNVHVFEELFDISLNQLLDSDYQIELKENTLPVGDYHRPLFTLNTGKSLLITRTGQSSDNKPERSYFIYNLFKIPDRFEKGNVVTFQTDEDKKVLYEDNKPKRRYTDYEKSTVTLEKLKQAALVHHLLKRDAAEGVKTSQIKTASILKIKSNKYSKYGKLYNESTELNNIYQDVFIPFLRYYNPQEPVYNIESGFNTYSLYLDKLLTDPTISVNQKVLDIVTEIYKLKQQRNTEQRIFNLEKALVQLTLGDITQSRYYRLDLNDFVEKLFLVNSLSGHPEIERLIAHVSDKKGKKSVEYLANLNEFTVLYRAAMHAGLSESDISRIVIIKNNQNLHLNTELSLAHVPSDTLSRLHPEAESAVRNLIHYLQQKFRTLFEEAAAFDVQSGKLPHREVSLRSDFMPVLRHYGVFKSTNEELYHLLDQTEVSYDLLSQPGFVSQKYNYPGSVTYIPFAYLSNPDLVVRNKYETNIFRIFNAFQEKMLHKKHMNDLVDVAQGVIDMVRETPDFSGKQQVNKLAYLEFVKRSLIQGLRQQDKVIQGNDNLNTYVQETVSSLRVLNNLVAVSFRPLNDLKNFLVGSYGIELQMIEERFKAKAYSYYNPSNSARAREIVTKELIKMYNHVPSKLKQLMSYCNVFFDRYKQGAVEKLTPFSDLRNTFNTLGFGGQMLGDVANQGYMLVMQMLTDNTWEDYDLNENGSLVFVGKGRAADPVFRKVRDKFITSGLSAELSPMDKSNKEELLYGLTSREKNKYRSVINEIFEGYTETDRKLIQESTIGALLMQYKSYLPNLFYQLFMGQKNIESLGNYVVKTTTGRKAVLKGNTFYDMETDELVDPNDIDLEAPIEWEGIIKEGRMVSLGMFALHILATKSVAKSWHKLSKQQKINVTRASLEIMTLLLVFAACSALLKALRPSDDDKLTPEEKLHLRINKEMVTYINRVYTEATSGYNPYEWGRSVAGSVPVVNTVMRFMGLIDRLSNYRTFVSGEYNVNTLNKVLDATPFISSIPHETLLFFMQENLKR